MYAIYAYIDPQNHPNVGIYGSPMECLGTVCRTCFFMGQVWASRLEAKSS